jgi:hypothetical protein
MKSLKEFLVTVLAGIVLIATSPNAMAFQEQQQAPLSASEIDSIVSPIALYPDQLVAQILGAATYPDQVTAASNFINSTKLTGDALMQEVNKQPWDPSVMALTQFPSVLNQMAQNLSWTSALGDAAYNQQADVKASIQRLRKQAQAAGNLKTTQQQTVTTQSQGGQQVIVIQPANPQVVYVPQYNPTVVYGTPYQPPGYSTGAMVATGLISFGVGMAVGLPSTTVVAAGDGEPVVGGATGTAAPLSITITFTSHVVTRFTATTVTPTIPITATTITETLTTVATTIGLRGTAATATAEIL